MVMLTSSTFLDPAYLPSAAATDWRQIVLLYDQLLFRPLVAWVDRFRIDQEPGDDPPASWVLTMVRRSRLLS